jgi:hypothetical protein
MEPLPKIVRERLKVAPPGGVHPDPDLLAGFVEQSITPREQAEVMGHLAGCADCREVVSLAAPQVELQEHTGTVLYSAAVPQPMPAAMRAVARPHWYSTPALRWGALGACVVLVGAAVLHYRESNPEVASVRTYSSIQAEEHTSQLREGAAAPSPSAPAPARSSSPHPKTRDELLSKLKVEPAPGPQREQRQESDAIGSLSTAGAGFSAPAPSSAPASAKPIPPPPQVPHAVEQEQDKVAFEISKSLPREAEKKEQALDKIQSAPASTNETVTVTGSAAAIQTETGDAVKNKDSGLSHFKSNDAAVATLADNRATVGGLRAGPNPPTLWKLSPQGRLLQSRTSGASWRPVPVGGEVLLRALCVNGKEIWVGGLHGALYYSSDEGEKWEPVKPSMNGRTLSADITAIEFADPLHGKLTTASQETWTTADGGHSWQVKSVQ